MVNNIYDFARYQLMTAALNWPTASLQLVAWAGTPNFIAVDKTISDIKGRGNTELGYSMVIAAGTVAADGSGQTNNVVIPSVPIGPSVTWFTMGRTGSPHDTGQLILYIDDAVNLPFVPNGLDLVVTPDWLQGRGWFKP